MEVGRSRDRVDPGGRVDGAWMADGVRENEIECGTDVKSLSENQYC